MTSSGTAAEYLAKIPSNRQKVPAWSSPATRVQSLTLPVQVGLPPRWYAGGAFPHELTAGLTVRVESLHKKQKGTYGVGVWASD